MDYEQFLENIAHDYGYIDWKDLCFYGGQDGINIIMFKNELFNIILNTLKIQIK
jgi:hypothetical protein